MLKYNLFQYTPNISNYNEHWNRPHVHTGIGMTYLDEGGLTAENILATFLLSSYSLSVDMTVSS